MTDQWIKSEVMEFVARNRLNLSEEQIDSVTEFADECFYNRQSCIEAGANYMRLNRADRFRIYEFSILQTQKDKIQLPE